MRGRRGGKLPNFTKAFESKTEKKKGSFGIWSDIVNV